MNRFARYVLGLAVVAFVAAYTFLLPTPATREPFDVRSWAVDSVMLLDEATTTTCVLAPPFRVVRGSRVTMSRLDEEPTLPVVRVDLTIDGEHVMIYARRRG
jgi:hypothetical protein